MDCRKSRWVDFVSLQCYRGGIVISLHNMKNKAVLLSVLFIVGLGITSFIWTFGGYGLTSVNKTFTSTNSFSTPYMTCDFENADVTEGIIQQFYGDEGGGSLSMFTLDGKLLDVQTSCDVAIGYESPCKKTRETNIQLQNCEEIQREIFIGRVPDADDQLRSYRETGELPQ